MIQFRFSFTSIITLFMFILCEIQSQFSCYECDILLFSSVYVNYICTRKLIFSLTKKILDWVKGQSFPDLVCASLITRTIYYDERWAISQTITFLFPLYACICTKPTCAEKKLGSGATWALVNVNRSDATPTVFQIKYFSFTAVH